MKSQQTTVKLLFMLFLIIGVSQSTEAQLLQRLKEGVKRGVEETISRKVENKAEEETEKAFDKIFNKKKKKKKAEEKNNEKTEQQDEEETNISSMMNGLMNSGNAKTESEYIFSITATLLVEDYSRRKTSETMKQSYGKNAIMSVMEKAPNPIINDFKNNSAILLNPEENIAQVMSLSWMQNMMGNAADDDDDDEGEAKFMKTGKKKTINGYTCYEYNIEADDTKMNAWFAPDVDFNYQDYLRGFAKMFKGKKVANMSALLNDGYGYVMEMTAYKNDKKISYMKVVELSKKKKVIDLSNYKIQKMF